MLDNYTKSDRHYHNLKHIGLMLDGLDRWYFTSDESRQTNEYFHLSQAILYHDVIYDARRNDNEELSDQAAYNALIPMVLPYSVHSICRLIMATKNHKPSSEDEAIIVDLDLAGLASHNYIRHSQQIRKEFAHATDEQWYYGRQAFLTNFLARPTIFHTKVGKARWEQDARINM